MVKSAFITLGQSAATQSAYAGPVSSVIPPPAWVADRSALLDATKLIAQFGDDAALEAAGRAERGRDLGNVVNFCRWRGIERVIVMLCDDAVAGTVH